MPNIRDSFWRGREFTSVEHMQAEAARWCAEVAGQRSCRPLDGAAPAAVFAAVEKQALAALPKDPFVLAEWSRYKVGLDIHVKVGQNLYSVPWKHIGATLDARSTPAMVQLFSAGTWSRPMSARRGASRPTWVTTRRRRSRSGCAPRPGAGGGPRRSAGVHGADRRAAGRQCPVPAPRRAGRPGPGGQAPARPARGSLREGDGGRRPVYRTVKGIQAAGTEASPVTKPAGDGGAPAFLCGPDALFAAASNVVPLRPGVPGAEAS